MERALAHLEQSLWLYLERAKRYWNHLELWNGLRPFGTEPWLYLERALAHLERPQGSLAALVLFVGRTG